MALIPRPRRAALVLLSGGVDSTTCLYQAKQEYGHVEGISIDYGQRHSKETEYARRSCEEVGAGHRVLDLKNILSGDNIMLTNMRILIPEIAYSEIQGVSPTYVPFRNGTLLSIIAAQAQMYVMQEIENMRSDAYYAEQPLVSDEHFSSLCKDLVGIYFGAHSEDALSWAYPDCTPEFIGAMANAIYVGTYNTVRLHTPLQWMNKRQVIQKGEELGVNWANTWSCYKGEELQCGVCPTCHSRRQGFQAAGVEDPTEYAQ